MDVFFDTNGVGYLDAFPPRWTAAGLARVRERLIARVNDGSISMFTSWALLEELVGLLDSDRDKYDRVMGFHWRVAQNNLLLATDDLADAEGRKAGRLEGNERLETWFTTVTVRRECLRPNSLDDIPRLTREAFEDFEREENERRNAAQERLEGKTGERALRASRRWWVRAEPNVEDWVRDHMRISRERLGLPDDEATWPSPRALESLWRFYAYKMARIHLNVGEGRRVRGSDLYDAHQYVSASYCDALVTDDGDFRATCAAIPNPRFTLYTFDEFTDRELGVSAS